MKNGLRYSSNDLVLIDRLWNLGRAYYNSGRYKDSLAILKKVYHAQKKLLGEEDENTLKTYEFIGSIYSTMGNYDKSLDILTEVWATKEAEYGEDDPETISAREWIELCRSSLT